MKSIVDRFRDRLTNGCTNTHLILVADSCYSGSLVQALQNLRDQDFVDLLKDKTSSLSIQASSAPWQKARGGVFTPWYLEKVFPSQQPPVPPSNANEAPSSCASGLYIPFQHAHFGTLGSLPDEYSKKFLKEHFLPVPLDATVDRGKKAKHAASSTHAVPAIGEKTDGVVHDIKLARNNTGHQLFAHVTTKQYPQGFLLHLHVQFPQSSKGPQPKVEDKTPSTKIPVTLKQRKGKWIWMSAPPKPSETQEKELKVAVHDARRIENGNYVWEPSRSKNKDVKPAQELTYSMAGPLEDLWKKSKNLFDTIKAQAPKKVVYLKGVGRARSRSSICLEEMKWENPDHWDMEGSLMGSFRDKECPSPGIFPNMRGRIRVPSTPKNLPLAECARDLKAAYIEFVAPGNPKTYCSGFTACIHWRCGTYLVYPSQDLLSKYRSKSDHFWEEAHRLADCLLRHWDKTRQVDNAAKTFSESNTKKCQGEYRCCCPAADCCTYSADELRDINDRLKMLLDYTPIVSSLE
ncbi:hypothetical protein HDU87_002746 [Geranomyces variabilis]|uniref:Uncharacterized protein n=1 Tax=Geranomyces variabilis TaxID=109894 RepID=A0AAD5XUX0_9FUNG|nr:hypothetical protein HDU87_002746 [Geranomyces variabilis]